MYICSFYISFPVFSNHPSNYLSVHDKFFFFCMLFSCYSAKNKLKIKSTQLIFLRFQVDPTIFNCLTYFLLCPVLSLYTKGQFQSTRKASFVSKTKMWEFLIPNLRKFLEEFFWTDSIMVACLHLFFASRFCFCREFLTINRTNFLKYRTNFLRYAVIYLSHRK